MENQHGLVKELVKSNLALAQSNNKLAQMVLAQANNKIQRQNNIVVTRRVQYRPRNRRN